MQIQIDREYAQWQHYHTGWVGGRMRSLYRIGPVAWQLLLVAPFDLVPHMTIGQVYDATVEHDGCGVLVSIQQRVEQPALGAAITLLSACRQLPDPQQGS
jgi:hypothetical protein